MAFAVATKPRRRPDGGDRPRVLVIGPASQHKVKIGEALGRAALNFADNLEKAKGALETGAFEMVVQFDLGEGLVTHVLPFACGGRGDAGARPREAAVGTRALDIPIRQEPLFGFAVEQALGFAVEQLC